MTRVHLPSDAEIRALHERLAPDADAFELVYTHCEIVAGIAAGLAGPALDAGLVRAGCLVHDIGVYRLDGPYIRHGVIGYGIMRELGFSEALSRFCARHTGVGITRDDIARAGLPLPPGDYVAETAEERLVMYADKFHSKTSPPAFVTAATYLREIGRFGPDKAAAFAAMVAEYGEPDLAPMAAAYGHVIR
ncbi:HD domain-containing protein [Paractinoplanes rhizophilus]|uniref:HD domain-containing protein n=1 Tax=Paractinoplanes rhizophilus TaxID=1416877 RepID=A0ABW2I435_9ACTN|nr:HD domain-containing protein [Actinoplanes sp.]